MIDDKTIESVKIPSSFLLTGDGKKSKQFVKDVVEKYKIDKFDIYFLSPDDSEGKARAISLKQIKSAQHFLSLTPNSKYKMLYLEEANLLKREAANALLKTLEEPPQYAIIILYSERDNLISTVKSRCLQKSFVSTKTQTKTDAKDMAKLFSEPFYKTTKELKKIVENNQTAELLSDMEIEFSKNIINFQNISPKILKEILQAKKDIANNVNPLLVLESLVLRYKNHVI